MESERHLFFFWLGEEAAENRREAGPDQPTSASTLPAGGRLRRPFAESPLRLREALPPR